MGVSNGYEKHTSEQEMLEAHTLILRQTLTIAGSFSLKCAVQLGVADIIHKLGRPATLSELASAASVPSDREPMLRRLMRQLVHARVFADADGGAAYALTPFSKLLLRDATNMSAYVLTLLDEIMVKPWFHFADWMRGNGASSSEPFHLAYGGRKFWEVVAERPGFNVMFNEAMACDARWVIKTVTLQVPEVFRGLKSLVDVGGGTGTAARIVGEAFPEIKCTVFDLPHVVDTMPEIKGVEAVGGDMFKKIPPAQAVMLKSIFHDWGDDDCVRILKRCKEAIPEKEDGGKIIIIDMLVNSQKNDAKVTETHLFFDVTMMIGIGGKEREEHEWKEIFTAAGFTDYKINPTSTLYSVIELYP